MNQAIVSPPVLPEFHFLRITEYESSRAGRKRRASISLRPVSCSSSSSSNPPQETATATASPPLRRAQKPFSDLANFKPRLPALPENAKDLATDLPFQYWYSHADLPPGMPKRRTKNPLSILTSEGKENRDSLDKRGRGRNGNARGDGSLWEAVLAVGSESNLDTPEVRQQGRGASSRGGGGCIREAEKGLLPIDHETRWEGGRATGGALEEKEGNAPLTEQEKKKLVLSCDGSRRQINVGWNGWNPNYVPLVHDYWKKSSVCKLKCKGVVTLDMDSFCKLVEEETGGKVIRRVGGTIYLFRGRIYTYWRDPKRLTVRHARVFKRFPKRLPVPTNLTKEDIIELRARGKVLPALCKPGKHGVYRFLLDDIRRAFETQDLVRVNCQGFHAKNLKDLGFHLQTLVPCELISFEFEHILMWRRKDGISPSQEVTQDRLEEGALVSDAQS